MKKSDPLLYDSPFPDTKLIWVKDIVQFLAFDGDKPGVQTILTFAFDSALFPYFETFGWCEKFEGHPAETRTTSLDHAIHNAMVMANRRVCRVVNYNEWKYKAAMGALWNRYFSKQRALDDFTSGRILCREKC